ncbi:unnamed protein product [Gordionus sp. m RMFG-2023]
MNEIPKYLRGYHKCNPEEPKILAALIYRVKYDCDLSSLTIESFFSKVAKDLIHNNLNDEEVNPLIIGDQLKGAHSHFPNLSKSALKHLIYLNELDNNGFSIGPALKINFRQLSYHPF